MEEFKLIPCPFCGNNGEIFEAKGDYQVSYCVTCGNDDSKCTMNVSTPWCDSKEEAVRIWNKRNT